MSKRLIAWITAAFTMVVMCGMPAVAFASDGSGLKKEETVYVVTDSAGNQEDVVVSDHLINNDELLTIADKSDLSGIENVKGDEKFKSNGKSIKWKAAGNDIYYQGKSNKAVPVKMNVTYKLDGQVVSGAELQGKSGDVEIDINYLNRGKFEGKTVPFIVLSGMLITDETFTDVKVDNGKIIDDGDKVIVVGMAAPGLAESLNLGANELGIGDSVKITGKANKFAVEDIMTIATNSVFEDIDTDKFGDLDYDSQINELDKGAKQLVDGSSKLYKGLNMLNSNIPALKDGVEQLHNGAKDLTKNVDSTFTSMEQGATKLVNGEKAVAGGLVSMQQSIGNTEETGTPSTIYGALGKIRDGIAEFGLTINSTIGTTEDKVSSKGGSSEGYLVQSLSNIGDAQDNLNSAKELVPKDANVDGAISDLQEIMSDLNEKGDTDNANKVQSVIVSLQASNKSVADSSSETKKLIDMALTSISGAEENIGVSVTVQNRIKSEVTKYTKFTEDESGILTGSVISLMEKVNNLYESFNYKDQQNPGVNASMQSIINGTNDLLDGINKANSKMGLSIYTGAASLANYLGELESKSGTLGDGTGELEQGSKQLSNGMSKLYNEGIKKIVDLYNDELKGTVNGLDNMMDAGKGYRTFTNLSAGMDGSVKFIYKTSIAK